MWKKGPEWVEGRANLWQYNFSKLHGLVISNSLLKWVNIGINLNVHYLNTLNNKKWHYLLKPSGGGISFIERIPIEALMLIGNTIKYIDTWLKTLQGNYIWVCYVYKEITKEVFKNIPPTKPVPFIEDLICGGSMKGGRVESSNNNPSHLKICWEIGGDQNFLPQVR